MKTLACVCRTCVPLASCLLQSGAAASEPHGGSSRTTQPVRCASSSVAAVAGPSATPPPVNKLPSWGQSLDNNPHPKQQQQQQQQQQQRHTVNDDTCNLSEAGKRFSSTVQRRQLQVHYGFAGDTPQFTLSQHATARHSIQAPKHSTALHIRCNGTQTHPHTNQSMPRTCNSCCRAASLHSRGVMCNPTSTAHGTA